MSKRYTGPHIAPNIHIAMLFFSLTSGHEHREIADANNIALKAFS